MIKTNALRCLALLPLIFSSCASKVPYAPPPPTTLVPTNTICESYQLCDFGRFNIGSQYWLQEAKKRFAHPIVVQCHGSNAIISIHMFGFSTSSSEWMLYPDGFRTPQRVEDFVKSLVDLAPDHDIVLVICNSSKYELKIPHVWYARGDCWSIPDDWAVGEFEHERVRGSGAVGSIWEFVSYDGRETPDPKPTSRPDKR